MHCNECDGEGGYYQTLDGGVTYYNYRGGYTDFHGNTLEKEDMEWYICEYCGGDGEYLEDD